LGLGWVRINNADFERSDHPDFLVMKKKMAARADRRGSIARFETCCRR
jgi:hypothetical protein